MGHQPRRDADRQKWQEILHQIEGLWHDHPHHWGSQEKWKILGKQTAHSPKWQLEPSYHKQVWVEATERAVSREHQIGRNKSCHPGPTAPSIGAQVWGLVSVVPPANERLELVWEAATHRISKHRPASKKWWTRTLTRPRAASRDTRLSQGMSNSPASTPVCSSSRKPLLSLSSQPWGCPASFKHVYEMPSPEAAWWAYQLWPWKHFLAMSSDIYSLEKCKGNIFLADSSLSNEVAIIVFQRCILSVKNVP